MADLKELFGGGKKDVSKLASDVFNFEDQKPTVPIKEEQELTNKEKDEYKTQLLKRKPIIPGAKIESYSIVEEDGVKYFIPVYDSSLKIPFNLSAEDVRDHEVFFDAFYRRRGVPFKHINIPTRERYKKDVNERGIKVTREFFKFGVNGHNIEIKIGLDPLEVPEPIYDMLIEIFKQGDIVERKIKAKAIASGVRDDHLELIGSRK